MSHCRACNEILNYYRLRSDGTEEDLCKTCLDVVNDMIYYSARHNDEDIDLGDFISYEEDASN